MNRKDLLQRILEFKRNLSFTYYKFLSTPHEYYPGEKMHMREVHVITEIGEGGLDNISELSERLNITKGAVSQYLKKLEKKGFIERVQESEDKRQYSVRLTEKGKELDKIHTKYDEEQYAKACPFFNEFTEEELELICRFEARFAEFGEEMLKYEKDENSDWGKNYI